MSWLLYGLVKKVAMESLVYDSASDDLEEMTWKLVIAHPRRPQVVELAERQNAY